MKPFLLVPKEAPHLCVQVDGDVKDGARLVLGPILPHDHSCRAKQVWTFNGSYVGLSKTPNMVLFWSTYKAITLVDMNRICYRHFTYREEWEKMDDDKFVLQFKPQLGLGVATGGMKDGSHVVVCENGEMCRFEFRDVKWNEVNDVPKGLNPRAAPDVAALETVKADLSLLFGTTGSGQAGTCYTDISLVKGYSATTVSNKLHKELCAAALREGSILARKMKDRYNDNLGGMVHQSLHIPRHKQETKLQLTISLDSPCFVYQMHFEATLTDGTTIEYYGGHFITGDVIDLDDDDDGATKDSHGHRATTWVDVAAGTKVEPETSIKVDEEKMEGLFVVDKTVDVEDKDSAEESHSDSSDWEDVIVE